MAPRSYWHTVFATFITFISLVTAQDQIPLQCYDNGVQVIALAGSNVPNGTYGLGSSFINNILNRIGNSSAISLNYNRFHPAALVGQYFVGEVNLGVGALTSALQNYTTACPNTPIVLHGYSEGGCVVMNTVCGGASPWTMPAPLSSSFAKNIIAVILYGEETWVAGQSYALGGCASNGPHLARSNSAQCATFAPMMQSFCLPDDADCCSSANPNNPNGADGQPWHYQYPTYFDDVAANFIVSQRDLYIKDTVTTAEFPTGVTEVGCFLDSDTRVLPYHMWTNPNNTAATCALACRQQGYPYSGTEIGNECWCGLTKPDPSLYKDGCWYPCAGDPIQSCGNGWRLSVYFDALAVPQTAKLPTGVVSMGCYVDSSTRALPVFLYSNTSNSNTVCALACRAAGYVYSGTEVGDECYCGSVAPSTIADNSTCSFPCPGTAYQQCGGGWRLNVQKDTTVTAQSNALPSGIVSMGCYVDSDVRTLPYFAYSNSSNSNNVCSLACRSLGFIYSGTEIGNECHCGNTAPAASLIADNSTCSFFCAGNAGQYCGGGWRLTMMKDTTVATPVTTPLPSGIVALGCYTDSATRTLQTFLYSNSTNNNNVCALACRAAGFIYSGTEVGTECHCGNVAPAASLIADNSTCSFNCAGVGNQLCGGGWRLTIQKDTTPTVKVTSLPSGFVAMGCYIDSYTRTLPVFSSSNQTGQSDTSCALACRAAGYQYAGTEVGTECYCGSSLSSTLNATASDCNFACSGDSTQLCGAGWRLSVFKDNNYKPFSNVTTSTRRSLKKGRYQPVRRSW